MIHKSMKATRWLFGLAVCVGVWGGMVSAPAWAAALPDVQVKVKPLDPAAVSPPPAFWSQPGHAVDAAPLSLANRFAYGGHDWVNWEGQWYISQGRNRGPWQWIPLDEVPTFLLDIPSQMH